MEILILVHAGSLCGSFWFNGGTQAEFDGLANEIHNWPEVVISVDNDLTHEIASSPAVSVLHKRAIASFPANGFDAELRSAAAKIHQQYPNCTRFVVTGLWVGTHGCVTGLAGNLQKLANCPVLISSRAIRE